MGNKNEVKMMGSGALFLVTKMMGSGALFLVTGYEGEQ
jgi:hypothetical protein